MALYQHFEDFCLKDPVTGVSKCLSDFGGVIINTNNKTFNSDLLPAPNHTVDTDSTRDGDIYISSSYSARSIDFTCMFTEDLGGGNMFELKQWLGKKHQQIFSWVGDDECKEIDVIYNKGFNLDVYYQHKFYGQVDLSFIAHNPYWRLQKEYPIIYRNVPINKEYIIRPKGNVECYPTITITPVDVQGTIKIKWNNLVMTLKDVDKPIVIDAESGMCYEEINGVKVMRFTKFTSDAYYTFPEIYETKPTKFTVLQGNIKEMSVKLNTKIL